MKIMQNSDTPIYMQIAEQMKTEILEGKLKPGEYLPSIRGLAKELRISVITTMKAYEQLESEGLVTAIQGKGFLVNDQNMGMLKEQHLRKVEEYLQAAIQSARVAGMTKEELEAMLHTLIMLQEQE
ncbi:MAG: GntR family transcriptional regulator [Lachnospiraceae bacterium]|nr:GntR family transcriptional regulator [Lachnospiraceae bacterium]